MNDNDIDHKLSSDSNPMTRNFYSDSNRTKENIDNTKHSNGHPDSKNIQQPATDTRVGSRRSQLPTCKSLNKRTRNLVQLHIISLLLLHLSLPNWRNSKILKKYEGQISRKIPSGCIS